MTGEEVASAFRDFIQSDYLNRKLTLDELSKEEVLELHRLVCQDGRVARHQEEMDRWDDLDPNFK